MAAWIFLTAAAACGGPGAPAGAPPGERIWVANIGGVVDQLGRDLELAGSGGATLEAARSALGDQADLYTILVAYTDFGGCSHMVAAAGDAPARFVRVERMLGSACALLERAARLFTRATSAHDPRALLAAGRATLRASPLLARARDELERAR